MNKHQLTREKIMSMEPGRKMDDLVAEIVMGAPNNKYYFVGNVRTYNRNGIAIDFTPSTDLSAAWEVVDKLKGDGECQVYWWSDHWECWFGKNETANAQTAPEAICRAALLSLIQEDTHEKE